ncbi:unnamed protein product [Menidia menidia]|uniref:RING-type E3 ubiquitin transferase n=1 Tax=Menidia menidia TaxID=238744 RepID=A0A8S4BZR2_9TELE|nr:unnamed protein product [Menidia menidia]
MQVNSGRFRCPSCRQEVVLDRHGVYGLQRNLLVENIIDVYKETLNDATSPLPSAPPPDQFPTCSDHEGEKVNIYCITCKVPTCSLCKVFGAHQSCQVAPLTDIYEKQKDELREEVTSLAAFRARVQAVISDLEKSCRNENCNTQKQSVCEKFSHIVSILEDRHKAMTQKIKSEQEEKIAHVQKLLRHYGDSMEANSKLMETAKTSMEDQDEVAFVQVLSQLNPSDFLKLRMKSPIAIELNFYRRVMAAATSSPSETLKPDERLSLYKNQKQSVCEKFSHIVSILEDRHKAMTQKIKSEQEEKIAHVQKLLRHYGDSMEANSKLMETAKTSMEDQDEVAFVQVLSQINAFDFLKLSMKSTIRVMAAATSSPSETLKPGYEKMSDYRFSFSKEETALRSIDFIKGLLLKNQKWIVSQKISKNPKRNDMKKLLSRTRKLL